MYAEKHTSMQVCRICYRFLVKTVYT